MNQIWYWVRAGSSFAEIKEVMVISQTKKFVIHTHTGRGGNYSSKKITKKNAIFPTLQEAIDWKINFLKENIVRDALRLENSEEDLKNFMKYVETRYPQAKL